MRRIKMYSMSWFFVGGVVLLVISIFGFFYFFQRYKWFETELFIYNERKIKISKLILRRVYWRRNKNLFGMILMVLLIGIGLWLINEWIFGLGILFLIYLTQ